MFRDTGDLELLGTLYERYMHLVYGVCLKYFNERERSRDGVTSIFEKLIVELPRHEVQNFKSWLYVLTKNYCLMALRAEKSETRKKKDWEIEQETFMESQEEMHPVDREEDRPGEALKDCINRLKQEQKQCIRLFYYEDKSYRDIAEMTGYEEKKVKSLLQNGKRNLKICLEEKNVR